MKKAIYQLGILTICLLFSYFTWVYWGQSKSITFVRYKSLESAPQGHINRLMKIHSFCFEGIKKIKLKEYWEEKFSSDLNGQAGLFLDKEIERNILTDRIQKQKYFPKSKDVTVMKKGDKVAGGVINSA